LALSTDTAGSPFSHCDLVTCGFTVTRVTIPPPSEVPLMASADGRWLLRQEREQGPRGYIRYLELWAPADGGWVRRPETYTSVASLPDEVRAAFGLP
jgi:hypothetical protein